MIRSERARKVVEGASAVLLALAAVLTAWCGYQATRWNGEQAKGAAAVSATRFEAARAANLADAQTQIDVATFTQWVDAYAGGDERLARFYRERFRAEFKPAVEAWIALRPLQNSAAPLTPFMMPEYQVHAAREAERLDRQADLSAAQVRVDLQRASNYVLGALLCSVALFFAGLSARLTSSTVRVVTLTLGWLVFLGTLAWVVTFPVSFQVS